MIREIMKSNVRRCPDKIAVIFKDIRHTYKEPINISISHYLQLDWKACCYESGGAFKI